MAGILEYMGMRFLRKRPHTRKRERKKSEVNIRNLWDNTETVLDSARTGVPASMQELIPDQAEPEAELIGRQETADEPNAVEMPADQTEPAEADAKGTEAAEATEEESTDAQTLLAEESTDAQALLAEESADAEALLAEETAEPEADLTDDALLGKIDEFREKARLLQKLMQDKESKAKELEALVEQRQDQAVELEQILEERKEAAEGVTEEVARRLDTISDRISDRLDASEEAIRGDISDGTRVNTAQMQQLTESVTSLSRQMDSVQERVTGIAGATDGIAKDTQSVHSAMNDLSEGVSGIHASMDSLSGNVQETVKNIIGIDDKFADITDQIHSENVKSYRNTVDLFKELEDKLERMETIQEEVRGVRKFAVGAVVFSVIDLLGVIALLVLGLL